MFFEIVNPTIKRNLETKRNALAEQKRKLESDMRKRSKRLSVIEKIICSGRDEYVTSALLDEEDTLSHSNYVAQSMFKRIESKITKLDSSAKFVDRTLASRPLVAV